MGRAGCVNQVHKTVIACVNGAGRAPVERDIYRLPGLGDIKAAIRCTCIGCGPDIEPAQHDAVAKARGRPGAAVSKI